MSLRFADLLRAAAALAALFALVALLNGKPETDLTGLAEVIDGDSLRLNGVEMRLSGVDAPEFDQTCTRQGKPWDCGRAARMALQKLVGRALTTCVGSEHDIYGRLLVVCRVRGVDINAEMVSAGFAIALRRYQSEETAARADARGIWAGPFERPEEWRKAHPHLHR